MSFVFYMIIIGAAAGFLASRVMNVNMSLAVGVLGALAGGAVVRLLLYSMQIVGGFLGAVLGAMALIWIYQKYMGTR